MSEIRISEEARHWQSVARKVAEEVVRPLAKKYDVLHQVESMENKTLFMTVGKNEADLTLRTYTELERWMNKTDFKGLRWKSVWFEGVDHGSMVGKSLYDGLLYIFDEWKIPDSVLTAGDVDKIEILRREIAGKYRGIDMPVLAETTLNAAGVTFFE